MTGVYALKNNFVAMGVPKTQIEILRSFVV